MSSSQQEKDPKGEEQSFQAQIKWTDLDKTPILFANQFLIQHFSNEFVLSIGQLTPPPILGEVTQEELEEMKTIRVRPVVRLAMTPDRLLELIDVLQKNFKKYQDNLPKRLQ